MTEADQIRAGGMGVSVESSAAKMVEFYETVEERHIALIRRQASSILRQDKIIQEFDKKINAHRAGDSGADSRCIPGSGGRPWMVMIARSTTPIARSPVKRKSRKKKPGHNPLFLAWLHTLPCFVCHREIFEHFSASELLEIFTAAPPVNPVEAAHIGRSTSRRGLGQKYPDKEAAPMCAGHHRTYDRSLHAMGPHFWDWYGINRDSIVDKLQDMFEASICGRWKK